MRVKHIFSRNPDKLEVKLQEFLNTIKSYRNIDIKFSTRSNKYEDGFSALVVYYN